MSSSCFAVTTSGTLYSWGYGDLGQLGTGEEQDENAPVEVSSRSKHLKGRQVMQVGAGGQHTVVLVCNAGVALTAIPAAGGGAGAAAGAAADGPATPGTAKKRNRPSGLPLSGRKSARK